MTHVAPMAQRLHSPRVATVSGSTLTLTELFDSIIQMSLIERFRTFVSFLKAYGDKEPGQDLLQLLESSPIKESNEYGFMLRESGLFIYTMLEHQKKLNELDVRTSRLLGSEPPRS